ncbi:hypothetical protein HZH66_008567 [Vespula vulgaris]|uniref:Uncharacterized protein n=1 Tax=Vespula vulgaris TaxID=7454 RepID=A0A834N2L6_VESVU|nr:hypothetical protein HZH66_008567 [Vespula vulgaris]
MVNRITSISFIVDNSNGSKEGSADFEKAVRYCGYGRFHYGLMLLCGMMFLSVGFQNNRIKVTCPKYHLIQRLEIYECIMHVREHYDACPVKRCFKADPAWVLIVSSLVNRNVHSLWYWQ